MIHKDVVDFYENLISENKKDLEFKRKTGQITPAAERKKIELLDSGLRIIKQRVITNQLDAFQNKDLF